jgi:tetratricopeptide (TPR) repeat protein
MISAKTQNDLNALLNGHDMSSAGLIAEQAIARGESHEILFMIAAQIRSESGDHYGAVELYRRAVQLAPANPEILSAAGDSMRYTGQLDEAIVLFDEAIACEQTIVSAWYGRALAFEAQGSFEEAQNSYIRVTQLAPTLAAGFAGLALLQSQNNNILEARKNVEQAQFLGPEEYETMIASACCNIADGQYQSAIEWLHRLLRLQSLTAENEILACQILGDLLDKLGFIDEAFNSYKRANERFAKLHAARNASPIALQAIESIDIGVSKLAQGELTAAPMIESHEVSGHVFLLGYPRSGTTLTEQILATIPNIVSTEEAPTFVAAEKYMSEAGIANLVRLTDHQIAQLRRDYWDVLAKKGVNVKNKIFVDMDPLKGSALPVIARLFPNAKILVMHRDPRDVVWSCYRHNFIYSPVTYEFSSLHGTAQHFSAMMKFMEKCIKIMPLNVHIVSYDELISDFDNTTKKICTFLGLPWSSSLRDFSMTARTRKIRTASGPQVRQALFDGRDQWRKYAIYLKPVMPFLEAWIEPSRLHGAS